MESVVVTGEPPRGAGAAAAAPSRGAALMVLVEDATSPSSEIDPAIEALRGIGDVLQRGEPPWHVGRVVANRASLEPVMEAVRRELRARAEGALEIALLVLVGPIAGPASEPALRGADGRLVSLRELASALRTWHAERHVLVVAGWPQGDQAVPALTDACVRALGSIPAAAMIAVGLGGQAQATLAGLFDGLAGRATDGATGTITLSSLAAELSRSAPGVRIEGRGDATTMLAPSGLQGAGDPRLSRLLLTASALAPAAAHAAPADDDLTGSVLPGQFRIDERFAHGGFGAVYRARQLTIGRDVAVKVLTATVAADPVACRLFADEIHSVGRIDHPNVVRIYQADVTADGRWFFAMEWLDGADLQRVIDRAGEAPPPAPRPSSARERAHAAAMPAARALAIVRQLLSGLAAAHRANLVHADLKPANVMLVPRPGSSEGERVVLLDFGLARLREADRAALSVGGTPAYMAPEQLTSGEIDRRSDLYAVALILVTLLTGWRRRSADQLAPPLEIVEDLGLRAVLARALAPRPDDRYATAEELSEALAAVRRHARRRQLRRGAAAALAIAAIAVGAAVAWRALRSEPPTLIVDGSGTVLWGLLHPVQRELEELAEVVMPIDTAHDHGSGGGIIRLLAGTADFAARSSRFDAAAATEQPIGTGRVLVEIAVGYDETALFVHRDNPLRQLSLAALQRAFCCKAGQRRGEELRAQAQWRELSLDDPAWADHEVSWILYGRHDPPRPKDSTSSTLLQADGWLCNPAQLCPSDKPAGVEAEQILAQLARQRYGLALSSRSFAGPEVKALEVIDQVRGLRLNGRKILWLYATQSRTRPMSPRLCRFLDAVTGPRVTAALVAAGKAQPLPDPVRAQQRQWLGLDDGTCATRTAQERLGPTTGAVARSPIGDALEHIERWGPAKP